MASIFDNRIMSGDDLAKIKELENAWNSTSDREQRRNIHNRAEAIRNSYGYSGGADGGEYRLLDIGTATVSDAETAYSGALQNARDAVRQSYSDMQEEADGLGKTRLREAYIKNMQNTLGLDQALKASGISGGLSESMRAAYGNRYADQREAIYADVLKAKQELTDKAAQAEYNSLSDEAEMRYKSASDRADRMTRSEQRDYDRGLDTLERELQNRKFEYQQKKDASDLELENRKFEYQKEKDTLDREAEDKKTQAELQYKLMNAQTAAQKQNNSQSRQRISDVISLMKSGYYSPEFAEILGFDAQKLEDGKSGGDGVTDYAWNMLEHGIYDESFPSILGYSEDVLKQYAQAVRSGLTK